MYKIINKILKKLLHSTAVARAYPVTYFVVAS